jgi:hypothetical protein
MHNLARLPYALARTVTRAVARTLTRVRSVALPAHYKPCEQAPKDRACQTLCGEPRTIQGAGPVARSRLAGRTVSTAPLSVVPRVVGLGPARHGRNRTPGRGDWFGCGHGLPGALGRVRTHRTGDPRAEAGRSGTEHGAWVQGRAEAVDRIGQTWTGVGTMVPNRTSPNRSWDQGPGVSRTPRPPTPYRPESRPRRPGLAPLHRHRTDRELEGLTGPACTESPHPRPRQTAAPARTPGRTRTTAR